MDSGQLEDLVLFKGRACSPKSLPLTGLAAGWYVWILSPSPGTMQPRHHKAQVSGLQGFKWLLTTDIADRTLLGAAVDARGRFIGLVIGPAGSGAAGGKAQHLAHALF